MDELLSEIHAFLAEHDMKPTRFGELVLNDKPFVSQLENGRDVKLGTAQKVRDFMANYKARAA